MLGARSINLSGPRTSLPNDVDVQLKAGNLLLAARKPEDAVARADAALKVQPGNIDALVLRGNALAGLRSFDDALESIEQAIKLDPDRGATYTNLGLLELAKGRRQQAEAALVRAVSLSPKDPRPRLALGNFYWATDRTRDAEQQFDAALQLEPANLAANRFMASLKFLTGRRAEAEPYLRRIADSSKSVDGTLALADYYLITARPKEAITRLEGLESGRNLPGVVLLLARAHAASGDLTKALSLVGEVLKANDRDAAAHLLKGQLLVLEGKREDGFAEIRTATTIRPSFGRRPVRVGKDVLRTRRHCGRTDCVPRGLAYQPARRRRAGRAVGAGGPKQATGRSPYRGRRDADRSD